MKQRYILDESQIGRTITRMSHEILERNKGSSDLVLLGIKTRGEHLAKRIQEKIESIDQVRVQTGTIDITNFRDDKKIPASETRDALDIEGSLKSQHVVVVDDVLYTGRTIRAALDAILTHDRPDKISLAVLIDRGHRELPIRADYIGKNIPTSKTETVVVHMNEVDGQEVVYISEETTNVTG